MTETKNFFAYIDISNPLVAWETAIGRICSVDQLEKQNIFTVSLRQFSIFKNCVLKDDAYKISRELEIEYIRSTCFEEKISRLRGIYFFNSLDHAEAIIGRMNWKAAHFDPTYLTEVRFHKVKYSEYDSEWITTNFNFDKSEWINNYLSGATCGDNPLTEVVASGVGVVLNNELRQRAYDFIGNEYPDTIPLLQLSCNGFAYGFNDIGQNIPYLLNTGDSVKGCHYLNMRHFENDSKFLDLVKEGTIDKPVLPPTWSGKISSGDFSHMGFECELDKIPSILPADSVQLKDNSEAIKNIENIHAH